MKSNAILRKQGKFLEIQERQCLFGMNILLGVLAQKQVFFKGQFSSAGAKKEYFELTHGMQAYCCRNSKSRGGKAAEKIDVIRLLTGLIAIGVLLIILGLLIYYLCQKKCKPRLPGHRSSRRHNCSIIFQRQEEFALNPVPPCSTGQIGLPTYDQAMALRENYDSPPPPYPGHSGKFKVFKKSLSLPGP